MGRRESQGATVKQDSRIQILVSTLHWLCDLGQITKPL